MKCPSCLYLEAIYIKFCFKRPFVLSFRGDSIIQVQHYPSDQTTAPSETHFNQHKERFFSGLPPQPSMIVVSSRRYQKLSSNSLDLAELEPKPVYHRQIRIFPVCTLVKIESFLDCLGVLNRGMPLHIPPKPVKPL